MYVTGLYSLFVFCVSHCNILLAAQPILFLLKDNWADSGPPKIKVIPTLRQGGTPWNDLKILCLLLFLTFATTRNFSAKCSPSTCTTTTACWPTCSARRHSAQTQSSPSSRQTSSRLGTSLKTLNYKSNTVETGYKVAICPRGKFLYAELCCNRPKCCLKRLISIRAIKWIL